MCYNPIDIFSKLDINKHLDNNTIYADVTFRGEGLSCLENVYCIDGFVGISDSNIEDFGDLEEITGELWTSFHNVFSPLKSLGKIKRIGGDVNLRYSNVDNLGELEEVGGKLSLRDTPVQDLGKLKKVGGNLFLPKRLENVIDTSGIQIGGKVRFWNDKMDREVIKHKSDLGLSDSKLQIPSWRNTYIYSFSEINKASKTQKEFYDHFKECFFNETYLDLCGNDNYAFILLFDIFENIDEIKELKILSGLFSNLGEHYPITETYCKQMLQERLEKEQDYYSSWLLLSRNDRVSIEEVLRFEFFTNKELLDSSVVLQIIGNSLLKNLKIQQKEKVKLQLDEVLHKRRSDKGVYLFNEFITKSYMNRDDEVVFKYNRNVTIDSELPYDENYYRKFYPKEKDYFHYLEIDKSQVNIYSKPAIPHLISNAIKFALIGLVKKAKKEIS